MLGRACPDVHLFLTFKLSDLLSTENVHLKRIYIFRKLKEYIYVDIWTGGQNVFDLSQ